MVVLHIVMHCRGKVHSFALSTFFFIKKGAPRGNVKQFGENMFLLRNFNMQLRSNSCIALLFWILQKQISKGSHGILEYLFAVWKELLRVI